jgi:hypothetical protein
MFVVWLLTYTLNGCASGKRATARQKPTNLQRSAGLPPRLELARLSVRGWCRRREFGLGVGRLGYRCSTAIRTLGPQLPAKSGDRDSRCSVLSWAGGERGRRAGTGPACGAGPPRRRFRRYPRVASRSVHQYVKRQYDRRKDKWNNSLKGLKSTFRRGRTMRTRALRAGDRQMEAATSPSHEATPRAPYQIIDPLMARAIQADVERTHPLFAWIIMRDLPEYPGSLAARLVTDAPTPWVIGSRCWEGRRAVTQTRLHSVPIG